VEKAGKQIESLLRAIADILTSIRLYKKQSGEMFDSLEKSVKLLKGDVNDVLKGITGSYVDEEESVRIEGGCVPEGEPGDGSEKKKRGRKKKA
jgi:hypothetical protein